MRMRTRLLIVSLSHVTADGRTYGSVQGITEDAPPLNEGRIGHDVQKFVCEPALVMGLSNRDFPCLCDIEVVSKTSGGKAAMFLTSIAPVGDDKVSKDSWYQYLDFVFNGVVPSFANKFAANVPPPVPTAPSSAPAGMTVSAPKI